MWVVEADPNPAPVIDLGSARERLGKESEGWRFRIDGTGSDMRLILESPDATDIRLTWGPGSVETIGRWLTANVNAAKQREWIARTDAEVPILRAAMNDAIVADRGGGRDAAAERKAEDMRRSNYLVWSRISDREKGRWYRLMRKRKTTAADWARNA